MTRSSIQDWLDWTYEKLDASDIYFGHGTANAWDEAVYLICGCFNLSFNATAKDLRKTASNIQVKKLKELVRLRISKKIPVAYLLNEAWFAGLAFYVDERVMIPRSSIAELIEQEFQPWVRRSQVQRILDIGTGSGCIAIACAKKFKYAQVDATDISLDALAVAKINVTKHRLNSRVHLFHNDLFPAKTDKKYDIIVSNPPYVSKIEFANLPMEYYHEPESAFLGFGKGGLDLVTKILTHAKNYLTPNGILVVEVGNSEKALLEKFPDLPFIWPDFTEGEGGIFILTAKDLHAIKQKR
jgi:ribosomal protein L3 glutamine methyltransferase